MVFNMMGENLQNFQVLANEVENQNITTVQDLLNKCTKADLSFKQFCLLEDRMMKLKKDSDNAKT